ncbi:MAG: sensor histidine kinase [Nitrosospira sp.]
MLKEYRSPSGQLRKRLSIRYVAALRAELGDHRAHSEKRAQALGQDAQTGGLRMLDLAMIHEFAVVALAASFDFAHMRNGSLRRAGMFFTQALQPMEVAQRETRDQNRDFRRRTEVLTAGNRKLEQEVARRKAGEVAIRKSKDEYRVLLQQSQAMQRKLRQLTRQIIQAQEDERKEISRELHDEVAQTLAGISVELSALSKGASVSLHALKVKITRTRRIVESSVKVLHRFARDLRPPALDDLGLIPALHAYNANLAARKKIKIQLTAFGGVEALGSAKRTALYRVAQEALTNVARHAKATKVHMGIIKIPGAIRMEISDNGKSFDVEKTLGARNRTRLGLIGMRERIEMVGGKLSITSKLGVGTMVRAEIPFTETTKE